ncbi:MAG: hypothetical protein A3K67_04085 [Euryarchaeota archaeon RBG_16_62_10]|nr:MAG: hypothetical protein A3K67_04085 [Euryarchaeota archaeon RBG_16_62_10]
MEASKTRSCVGCGRAIAWDANVCPYCGHDYRMAMAPPVARATISDGMKILLYLVSFFIPLAGLIIGAIYYSKPEPEFKHVGKMCIILALLPILLVLLCWFVLGVAWLSLA